MEGTAGFAKPLKDERCWREFKPGTWCTDIDVRDFIIRNVTPYAGDEMFLAGPSKRTDAVWNKLQPYFQDERKIRRARCRCANAVDSARSQGRLHRSR